MAQLNVKKLLKELRDDYGVQVPKGEESFALSFIERQYPEELEVYKDVAHENEDITPHEYAMSKVGLGIIDGTHMNSVEVTDLGNGFALQKPREQEIIEVDQATVKESLKHLITQENKFLAMLYAKWEEYNKAYFLGELSTPIITFDKMDNRTLGHYVVGSDTMGLTHHIAFNRNFIAMNTDERILETLRHEMIHQWQDEILYIAESKKGKAQPKAKPIKYWSIGEDGEKTLIEATQKRRPKDWHNKDFRAFADVVGIPAKGDKCYGNPAKMPEPKSYNRKFICSCVASNGYHLTVWSTRTIHAVCQVCKQPLREVPKGGKLIRVEQSHVERPGEDAVEIEHMKVYNRFKRFKTKLDKVEFLDKYGASGEPAMLKHTEGVYQKGHNKYKEGFTHWVAYSVKEAEPKPAPQKDLPKPDKKPTPPPAVKKAPKNQEPEKPAKPARPAKLGFALNLGGNKAQQPKKNEKPKKPQQKVNQVPAKDPQVAQAKPKEERSHKNAQDLLDVYKECGSIKGVAEYFGTVSGTILYQAKKLGVDFKKGVIASESK